MLSGGYLDGNGCSDARGSRPAFLIPSSLIIEVDGDEAPEAPNPLEQYTTKELMAEFFRRID